MAILGVDVGGTFTDAVLLDGGRLSTAKVPTARRQEESVVAAARAVGAGGLERFTHGTTIATNALLERKGSKTAFVATAGFEHLLHLRRQTRAHLYRLCADHPEPLVPLERCYGVRERMGPEGVLEPLDLDSLPAFEAEAVAVCLRFAFRDPSHERLVAEEVRRRLPGARVVASHEVAPEFREYERASTTAADAYLGPVLARYLGSLAARCEKSGLPAPLVMRSSGGLATLEEAAAHPSWVLVSGPAAGVVGAARVAALAGQENAISFQEGIVIPPVRLDDDVLAVLLANMRNPDERRGDLRAQLAAHRLAERRIAELCARRGRERVTAAMDELFAYSERRVRAAISELPDGRYETADALEALEGELEIRARVTVRGDDVEIDFAGTSPQHEGNLNCPLAVTRSASYFVVRCLTDPDVPASGGAFAPVTVRAPLGSLVNARPPAAVVAGNVETSNRIVDVLFAALGHALPVPAQGQGTMNNVTFGNARFTYYETIGGGQGACPRAQGPSGVHVTMSNTLNTPIEALELSYPIRVSRYGLRLGSGGNGRFRGGDGVVRELQALEACRFSVVSERRARAPRGARGGAPGAPGRNLLNGEELPAKATLGLEAGDVVTIETPGGGGFGRV